MDTVDKATRTKIMSSVGQRNTKPEMKIRRALHALGFRYRLNVRSLPGSPDLVFPKYRSVIFVQGCFWHSHDCKYATKPATRKEFWAKKFESNRKRDKKKALELRNQEWRVLVVWECATKGDESSLEKTVMSIVNWLESDEKEGEI